MQPSCPRSYYDETTSPDKQKRQCLTHTRTEHVYFNHDGNNIWWALTTMTMSTLHLIETWFIFYGVCIKKNVSSNLTGKGAIVPDFSLGEGLIPNE